MAIKIALANASAFGEPDAGKLASPVRRGTVGNVLTKVSNALAFYPTQGVAGSSPARCVLLSTVSLRALYTLFDNNQTVMEGRADGFFVCQNAFSDHLTHNCLLTVLSPETVLFSGCSTILAFDWPSFVICVSERSLQ